MTSLIKKELMARWPYLVVAFLLGLEQILGVLVGDSALNDLSTQPLEVLKNRLIVGGLLCFGAAHGAIIQEFRDGHIEFINGLPLRRWKLYCAKVLVSVAVVAVLVVMATLALLLAVWLSKDASHGSALTVVASVLGLYLAGLLGFCGAGLLFSWLGGVGWGLLLCAIVALIIPGAVDVRLRPLGLRSYMDFEFMGKNAVVYGWAAYGWLGSFVGCVVVSWFAFSGPGEVLIRVSSGLMASSRRALTVVVGGVLVLIGMGTIRPFDLIDALVVDRRVIDTEHFRVLYRAGEAEEAEELIAKIDDIDREVRGIFGASEVAQVVMEFTGGGRFHSGRYTGGKISLDLGETSEATLAHELAHAYADRLAGGFSDGHHGTWRFFNEGLATWVGWRVAGQADTRVARHRWAGAVFARGQHEFDLLVQDAARSRLYDSDEVYSLGFVFVEALVELHGERSPACILTAFGEFDSGSVTGKAAWYAASKRCGFNLDRIIARYEDMLAGHQPMVKTPELASVSTVMFEGDVYLSIQGRQGATRPGSCRVRRSLGTSRPESRVSDVDGKGLCRIPERATGPLTFYYQLGTRLSDGVVEYGPWVKAWVPSRDEDCQTYACLLDVCDSLSCLGDAPAPLWAEGPNGTRQAATEPKSRTEVQLPGPSGVESMKYGPRGRYIASIGKTGQMGLWDSSRLRLIRMLKGHDRPVLDFDIAPDGDHLVAVTENQVIAWRVPSGEILWQRSLVGLTGGVGFASHRQFLVVGQRWGYRRSFEVLNAMDGRHLASIELNEESMVDIKTLEIVGNDEKVLLSDRREVGLFELENGAEVRKLLPEGRSSTEVCGAGAEVAVGTRAGQVETYDLMTGVRRWSRKFSDDSVRRLIYSPDCERLLVYFGSGSGIAVLDTSDGASVVSKTSVPARPVLFSPDGASIIGDGSKSSTLLTPELEMKVLRFDTSRGVTGLRLSSSGHRVATNYPLQVFDTSTGMPVTFHRDSARDGGLVFSADGQRVLSTGYGGAIDLLEETDGWRWRLRKVAGSSRGARSYNRGFFLPGGTRVALSDDQGQIEFLDLASGMGPRYLFHTSEIVGMGITADNRGVSAERDGHMVFWDLDSGAELNRLKTETTKCARVSPDGKLIAEGRHSSIVIVRRTADLVVVARYHTGHGGPVALAFSPDGRKLAIGSQFGYVRIFDLDTREGGLGLQAHAGSIIDLEFLPDGTGIVSAGKDSSWAVWDLPDGGIRYRMVSDLGGEWVRWDSEGVPTASEGAQKYIHQVKGFEVEIPSQAP